MDGGNSPYSFGGWPCNLEAKLAWSWTPPEGKYTNTGVHAPLVDADMNLYVAVEKSMRKFSPDGQVLWTFRLPPDSDGGSRFRKMPTIVAGLLVNSVISGDVLALDMKTGAVVWRVEVTESGCIGDDFGFLVAGEGVVVGDAECPEPLSRKMNKVFALNATNGAHLWDFRPDVGTWNFQPHLLGDGTLAFQTWDGGVYRLRLHDGSMLWHAYGGGNDSWTDGGPAVGPNGVFYAVRSSAPQTGSPFGKPGFLDAYNLTDGTLLWSNSLDQTPYAYPAVGHLREGGPLAVVTGVGSLAGLPLKLTVWMGVFGSIVLSVGCGISLCLLVSLCTCRSPRSFLGPRRRGMFLKAACVVAVAVNAVVFAFAQRHYQHSVQAFDAATGSLLWRYDLPPWKWYCAAGDEEGMIQRKLAGATMVCLPLASSAGVIDAQGIFYMGDMDGKLYAIQDRNNDGRISEDTEVCTFDTGGAFMSAGATLVPGMMAVGTCDSLYVFKQ